MKITIYSEQGLDIDLHCISENISRLASGLDVVKGKTPFNIKGPFVMHPGTYTRLPRSLLEESTGSDQIVLFTEKAYDNNYFFESLNNTAIISLSGWDHLTNLPQNNGVVFFVCAIVIQTLGIGTRHDKNTGCINDFWMDKTGVDLGMRSGTVCSECLVDFRTNGNLAGADILSQIQNVLGELAAASRTDMDICEYWRMRDGEGNFDVFVCHNSRDKDEVRKMNGRLQAEHIRTWFDEEQLPPGRLWQELLEEQISQIKSAAVFVGQSGTGPWQDIELRAFLSEFMRRRCPIIPVILPKCVTVPNLPLFLRQFTWVDFRRTTPDPFAHLLWGIRGKKPTRR